MKRVIERVKKGKKKSFYVSLLACWMLSCMQQKEHPDTDISQMSQKEAHDTTSQLVQKDSLPQEMPISNEEKIQNMNEDGEKKYKKQEKDVVQPYKVNKEEHNGNKYDSTDENIYNEEPMMNMTPLISKDTTIEERVYPKEKAYKNKDVLLKSRGITLDRLKYMGFMFVKMNTENMKSVQEIYDSGSMDTLVYERTKLSIEKNLRIVHLLNQIAQNKSLNDVKFASIYLEQLVSVVKEGLVVSQEVLRYLQSIYDTNQVSQQKYIASADNLKTNVNLMWDIIKEIDF